ncbi:MotE family protein [Acuticoccus sp. I52.16.1]|uniref:MotE family protein n=1 Tax=Acuticoccus sp. I52.16.1 TaxID=2928472 RepID=UPI001FD04A7E|nr:MotE family protein [Acuticoccus sp. I52.16.1]UOM34302.1 MotE family protein [Acuticoccus sp. I52.16.1]
MTHPLTHGASAVALAIALLATPFAAPGARAQDSAAAAYCTNLADEAGDARFARKLARLQEAEDQVNARLQALEAKRQEYESWLSRREKFLKLAEENLVAIYAGMRPDAASAQLAEMHELQAAAVIAKVSPRTASAILNEMEAAKAARIAAIMAGLSRDDIEGMPS